MPVGDVELLRYRSLSDINGEDSLAQTRPTIPECHFVEAGFSMLKLSKTRITVGDSVTVYWDIHENCSANDWIGLFDLGKWTNVDRKYWIHCQFVTCELISPFSKFILF